MKKRFILSVSAGLIILLSTLNFTTSRAQINDTKKDHLGFSVSFGSRLNKISSDHSAIDKMKLVEEGASVGLLWGNDIVETKVTVGYYYSASGVPHTVDLVNVESSLQFYPLYALSGRTHKVQPYLTTGFSANNYKLYGFYLGGDGAVNYSVAIEPYLGNVTSYFGFVGAGFEVNLLNQNDFVKFFSEVNYQSAVYQRSSEQFKNTRVSNQLSINVGLSFGLNRFHNQ